MGRGEGAGEIGPVLQFARMAGEDGGGLGGQRAVDEDVGLGHLALIHQLDEVGDEFLRALDREGGNEQCALLLRCVVDLARQDLAAAVLAALEAVTPAIGRFADDEIEVGGRFGIEMQHLVVRARDRPRTAGGAAFRPAARPPPRSRPSPAGGPRSRSGRGCRERAISRLSKGWPSKCSSAAMASSSV